MATLSTLARAQMGGLEQGVHRVHKRLGFSRSWRVWATVLRTGFAWRLRGLGMCVRFDLVRVDEGYHLRGCAGLC